MAACMRRSIRTFRGCPTSAFWSADALYHPGDSFDVPGDADGRHAVRADLGPVVEDRPSRSISSGGSAATGVRAARLPAQRGRVQGLRRQHGPTVRMRLRTVDAGRGRELSKSRDHRQSCIVDLPSRPSRRVTIGSVTPELVAAATHAPRSGAGQGVEHLPQTLRRARHAGTARLGVLRGRPRAASWATTPGRTRSPPPSGSSPPTRCGPAGRPPARSGRPPWPRPGWPSAPAGGMSASASAPGLTRSGRPRRAGGGGRRRRWPCPSSPRPGPCRRPTAEPAPAPRCWCICSGSTARVRMLLAVRACGLTPIEAIIAGPDGEEEAVAFGWHPPYPARAPLLRRYHLRRGAGRPDIGPGATRR